MRKVVALCAIGVVGGAAACSRPQAQSVSPAVPTVAVAKVTRGDVSQALTVAAEFRPFQEIDVHAKVAGYLKSINVDVGDRVEAGQLLAVLEVPEMQDELQQDEAAVSAPRRKSTARRPTSSARSRRTRSRTWARPSRRASSKARPNLVAQQDIDEATGRDRVAEAQVATAKAALAVGAAAAGDRREPARPGRRRSSPTRGSRRRLPASSPIATPIPAR